MSNIIGIDLGTTYSLCAIFNGGLPQLVPNAHHETLTPSIIGVLPKREVIIGTPARELRVVQPERCAWSFKRYMGVDHQITMAGRAYSATELSSLVLRSLKDDATRFLGESIDEAVITVPAYFNDHQRKATRMAGKMAGLTVRRIINEPTAAALVYGFHDREAEKHLCVIDLGGGTFDVTVMETFDGTLEIVATAGESMLGGEDFTDRLVAAALRHVKLQLEPAELKQPLRVARLRLECENAKVQLGVSGEARIRVPDTDGTFNEHSPALKLNESTFASLTKTLTSRITRAIDKAMRDSERNPSEIDDVILVGGATRMPLMHDLVRDYFGSDPLIEFNPDEVVALGAAVQAALIEGDAAVADMVMTDVCPYSLGVEVAKEFGGQTVGGYFSPVIHRNTTIPVSREEVYTTIMTNQPEILLHIFQGEARKTKDNLELGQLRVTGIPPGPAGTEVRVRFTYDLNGILEVEAIVAESGQRFNTLLTNYAQGMNEDELAVAVEKLQALKFYPRDDVVNRRLVLFCERVVGEISPLQRGNLEEAIDVFEQAMSSGEREFFESSRAGLLVFLSQLGFEYDESTDDGE